MNIKVCRECHSNPHKMSCTNKSLCLECTSRSKHALFCSQQDDGSKLRTHHLLVNSWNFLNEQLNKRHADIALLQGKLAILKHENNKLRNACYRKEKSNKNNSTPL